LQASRENQHFLGRRVLPVAIKGIQSLPITPQLSPSPNPAHSQPASEKAEMGRFFISKTELLADIATRQVNDAENNPQDYPVGLPSPQMLGYPSTPWNDNLCWLDSSLELLTISYAYDKTLWRKIETFTFKDKHDPKHVWVALLSYLERRRLCYETTPAKDLKESFRRIRNDFSRVLFAARLIDGSFGCCATPWVRFFVLLVLSSTNIG
jgi:hypothetical protein